MARDAILCCLGKKGYALHDEWVADPATKANWQEFLQYFESTLDIKVRPWVQVYDLEAIHKKHEEAPHDLEARICHMTSHTHIGDGSARAIEFKVQ